MLTFHCSDCNETINGGDDESADQIFGRLEDHVEEMPRGDVYFRRNNRRCPAETWRLAISH